jgi:hypothetical protein
MTYIKAALLSAIVAVIFFAWGYATAERDIHANALERSAPESCESRPDPIGCLITSL